jgi:hypothetical protein
VIQVVLCKADEWHRPRRMSCHQSSNNGHPPSDLYTASTNLFAARNDERSDPALTYPADDAYLQPRPQQAEGQCLLIGFVYSTDVPDTYVVCCNHPACSHESFVRRYASRDTVTELIQQYRQYTGAVLRDAFAVKLPVVDLCLEKSS